MILLVYCAGCGSPSGTEEQPVKARPDTALTVAPTLKDTLLGLLAHGLQDSASHLLEMTWTGDSAQWTSTKTPAAWRTWASRYAAEMLEPAVRTDALRATQRLTVLITAGNAHAAEEHRLLADLHREASKYYNRVGWKDEAFRVAEEGYALLAETGDTVCTEGVGLLNALGIRSAGRGDLVACHAYFHRSIDLARALGDSRQEATQLVRFAAYVPASDSSTAMSAYRQAEQTAQAGGDTITWSTVLNGKGAYIHDNFGGYDSSSMLASARLMNAYSGQQPERYLASVGNVIVYCRETGQFGELESWMRAFEKKVGEQPFHAAMLVSLRTNQALEQKERHDHRASVAYAMQAVEEARKHGLSKADPQTAIRAYLILTAAHTWAKDYPATISTAEEALAEPAFLGTQEQGMRSDILQNLGNAKGLSGDHEGAIPILRELSTAARMRHLVLNNLALYLRDLSRYTEADSCSLLVLEETDPAAEQRTVANIAFSKDRLKRGPLEEAERFAAQALLSSGTINSESDLPSGIEYDPSEVSRRFDAIVQWCRVLNARLPERAESLNAQALTLNTDSVLRIHIDTLLRITRDPVARVELLDLMTESLDRSIRIITDQRAGPVPWKRVLQLMESRRDHRLRSLMQEDQTSLRCGVPPELLHQERDLSGLLETLMRREETDDLTAAETETIWIRDSLDHVQARIHAVAPGYYTALNGFDPVDPHQIRSALDPDQRILVLHLDTADGSLTSVCIAPDTLYGERHAIDVVELRSTLSALRSGATSDHVLPTSLISVLLAPLEKVGRGTSLVVLLDGELWGLPFDQVLAEHGDAASSASTIQHASSLSAFHALRQPGSKEAGTRLLAFAPSYENSRPSGAVDSRQVVRDVAPLTQNTIEVDCILELANGTARTGDQAQEIDFRQQAPTAGVIHLALHGVLDARQPLRSHLLFGAGSETSNNDGALTVAEIYDLKLSAELAVLSACETGVGKAQSGEGIQSIARAFNYAGVPNVVSSLWKVDDLATKEIMVKFYEHLADGMGKADALAEAKRWYRKEYPNEPPSKWAAFILIGDNEPVRLKKRSPVRPWMWGGAIALVLAAVAARRWRRRAQAA